MNACANVCLRVSVLVYIYESKLSSHIKAMPASVETFLSAWNAFDKQDRLHFT